MKPSHSAHHQAGFSLIEILVGLAIGLLATLVIMQVFSVFEGQKRTTTGSADAQTNGSIALYFIGNELKMAGYGLLPSENSPLECTTLAYGTSGITSISPVTITDGGTAAGASDSITIRYGSTSSGGVNSQITGVPSGNQIPVDNNMSCNIGDMVIFTNSNGTQCNFTSVTALSAAGVSPVTVSVADTTGASSTGANLSCLGAWNNVVFQVNPSYNPTNPANSQPYMTKNGDPAVADIVNIQAQYGISATANSNLVNQWVDATGSWADGALTVANRNRIKAVRIAVVARNGLLEKDKVSFPCSSLTATSPVGLCAWDATSASPTVASPAPAIDLSNDQLTGDPANNLHWQHYRYRVFETIIPLRNMIWSKDTLP